MLQDFQLHGGGRHRGQLGSTEMPVTHLQLQTSLEAGKDSVCSRLGARTPAPKKIWKSSLLKEERFPKKRMGDKGLGDGGERALIEETEDPCTREPQRGKE